MTNKPATIAVTYSEGGRWQAFADARRISGQLHAIAFDDGSIWDVVNGWHAGLWSEEKFPAGLMPADDVDDEWQGWCPSRAA